MELRHIGVLRLHELASTNGELSMAEAHHLCMCAGCMKVFEAIARQLHLGGSGSSQTVTHVIDEDETTNADLPWAL